MSLGLAFRHSRRSGFAVTVVSTLALTIGVTTAVFSVFSGVILRALPFASPERLVFLTSVRPDVADAPFTLPEYMDYRAQTRSLSGLAAYASWSGSLATSGGTERLSGARVSGNAFEVLGVRAAAGRLLNDADDRPDAPRVALLSHRVWQRLFGGAPDAVGRVLRLNGEPVVLAGILPRHFPLPLRDIDVVVPLSPDRDPLRHERNSVNFLRFLGRLKPGVSTAAAQSELTAICLALRRQFPAEYARKDGVRAVELRDGIVGDHRRSLFLLFASAAVVLGAALANLVSLLLVRTAERSSELSLRVALGASRANLVRQLSAEALLLTLAGGGLGLGLAVVLARAALAAAPASLPRVEEVGIDARSVLLALALTAGATLLFTVVPLGAALRARASLALETRGSVGGRRDRGRRQALVVGEIAAALVLLLATVALLQSLARLRRVPLGFAAAGAFQARVSLPPSYRTPEDLERFVERLSSRITAAPGVRAAGLVSSAPLSGVLAAAPFTVEGAPPRTERDVPSANLRVVTPGYFAAAETRLLRGRDFSETDRAGEPAVAIVSEALARRFVPGDPLGRRLLVDDNNSGPRPVEIVGVVENVAQTKLDGPPSVDLYLALPQVHADAVGLLQRNQFWVVRRKGDPAAFRVPFVEALRAVDPDAAVSATGTLSQYVEASLAPRRFGLGLLVAFAATVILIAVSGLYGLVAYTVSRRRREIAVRMAVGATARDVERRFLGQSIRLSISGAAVGLGSAVALRPVLGGSAADAVSLPVLLATAAALTGVVTLAGWLPARRAARIEPVLALRGD